MTTFRELGVLAETAEALERLGITEAFPVQAMTLPVALSGSDIIGQAKTGTGKTLGFGIPLLQRVATPAEAPAGANTKAPQALVVVPTRELCVQVAKDLHNAGVVRSVRVLAAYGGRALDPQTTALRQGVEVVVGTPGRLLDLARRGQLDLSHVRVLVLDEADEMLDQGFLPNVEEIIALTPATRQTMLFSATMPGPILDLGRRYMNRPTHIRITDPEDSGATVSAVTQHVFRAHAMDKVEVLARVLQAEGRGLAMVFCRTKRTADKVATQLTERGFAAGAVHGDLGQGAREQALRAFRTGKVDVLVATDVAARGLDVDDVTHVINFQCPEDEKTYLHRIGRTARAGRSGTAVTFVDWDDLARWALTNTALNLEFPDPQETYSTSAHLYEALNIPAGTTGTLPVGDRTRAGLDAEQIEDLGEPGRRTKRSGKPAAKASSGKASSGKAPAAKSEAADATADAETGRGRRRSSERRRTRGGKPVATEAA